MSAPRFVLILVFPTVQVDFDLSLPDVDTTYIFSNLPGQKIAVLPISIAVVKNASLSHA